jgi:fumarylacetoacetate (FAA) hydrolase
MKLVSFYTDGKEQAGLLVRENVYALTDLQAGLPATMRHLLEHWSLWLQPLQQVNKHLHEKRHFYPFRPFSDLRILAPVTEPGSCRDGYAFRQHVETARLNRGLGMIEAFDSFPVFYFTNHRSIQGPGAVYCQQDHFSKLDFELEAAVVIGKQGKNIPAASAEAHIAGLMIMNDFSARTLQMEEMQLNLGPAKGKDFATATGPVLVTLDELADAVTPCKPGHTGTAWDLSMKAFVNGTQVSQGSLAAMDWTFAEIIARASYGVTLYPGDIIGSGTVGTGCFLELNGTGKRTDESYREQWLQEGDRIGLEIDCLGTLSNFIVRHNEGYSAKTE